MICMHATRVGQIVGLAVVLLTGCGGGGGGGGGGTKTLYLSLSYPNAMASLWQPATLVPQINGLQGNAPNCSLAGGRLPAGLVLQEDCRITGSPTELGDLSATIRLTVRGFEGQVDTPVGLTVVGPSTVYMFNATAQLTLGMPVSEMPGRYVNGSQWSNWTPQVGQTLKYRVAAGTLPAGLAIDSATGALTGVPATAGTHTFTVAAEASQGSATANSSTAYTVQVLLPDIMASYEGLRSLPYAVGDVVSAQPTLRFGSGVSPSDFSFSYRSAAGSSPLPPGLALDKQNGEIGGTLTGPVPSNRGEAVEYQHSVVVSATVRGVSFDLPAMGWRASVTPPPLKPGDGFLPAPASTTSTSASWQRVYATTVESQYAHSLVLYPYLTALYGPNATRNTVQFMHETLPQYGVRSVVTLVAERQGVPLVANEDTVLAKTPLTPGLHQGTVSSGAPELAAPVLGVGCGSQPGAFKVHEVAYAEDGSLNKLAVDYAQPCQDRISGTVVMGAIRHNSSVPLALDTVYAVPGRSGDVLEGMPFVLNGSASWSPVSPVVDWRWRQVSGPAFDLDGCKPLASTCRTYVPLVPAGGAAAVFELQVTTLSGRVATEQLNLRIRSTADRQSLIQQRSANGQVATTTGPDLRVSVLAKTGTESIYLLQRPDSFYISAYGNRPSDDTTVFGAQFAVSTPDGSPFVTPQVLSGQGPAEDGTFGREFFAGVPPLRCATAAWELSLPALVRDPSDLRLISQMAAWFSVRCPSGETTFSRIWIDHLPVTPPTARASGPSTVPRGAAFTLTDAGSSSPLGPLKARLWTQVHGPAPKSVAQLPDGGLEVTPADNTPDGTRLVFVLEAVDVRGQPSLAMVRVQVSGGPAPLRVDGQRPAARR